MKKALQQEIYRIVEQLSVCNLRLLLSFAKGLFKNQ